MSNKDLLLIDLSARLPYNVRGVIGALKDGIIYPHDYADLKADCRTVIPYLRPLSSMTEDEFSKLKEYSGLIYDQLDLASFQDGACQCLDFYLSEVPVDVVILVFDWLNAHHFDYRG